MKKFFNKNNKGFTLVELIVVIAVIAVISIMVAPRFIEYVEKSRRGTDRNAVKELAHAVQVGYVTIKTSNPGDTTLVLEIGADGNASYSDSVDIDVDVDFGDNSTSGTDNVEVESLVGIVNGIVAEDSYVYKSKLYKGQTITFTVSEDGIVTIDAESVINQKNEAITKLDEEVKAAKAEAAQLEQQYKDAADFLDGCNTLLGYGQSALNLAQKTVDRFNKWGVTVPEWAQNELTSAQNKVIEYQNNVTEATNDMKNKEKLWKDKVSYYEGKEKELADLRASLGDESIAISAGELNAHIHEFD